MDEQREAQRLRDPIDLAGMTFRKFRRLGWERDPCVGQPNADSTNRIFLVSRAALSSVIPSGSDGAELEVFLFSWLVSMSLGSLLKANRSFRRPSI